MNKMNNTPKKEDYFPAMAQNEAVQSEALWAVTTWIDENLMGRDRDLQARHFNFLRLLADRETYIHMGMKAGNNAPLKKMTSKYCCDQIRQHFSYVNRMGQKEELGLRSAENDLRLLSSAPKSYIFKDANYGWRISEDGLAMISSISNDMVQFVIKMAKDLQELSPVPLEPLEETKEISILHAGKVMLEKVSKFLDDTDKQVKS